MRAPHAPQTWWVRAESAIWKARRATASVASSTLPKSERSPRKVKPSGARASPGSHAAAQYSSPSSPTGSTFAGERSNALSVAASGRPRSRSRTRISLPRNANVRGRSCATGASSGVKVGGVTINSLPAPCLEVQELAPRPGPVGDEGRIGPLAIFLAIRRHAVLEVLLQHVLGDRIHLERVQAEHFRAQRRGHFGIAMPLAQLGRDLEGAERLDLVLRRSVPDRVRAPQDVVGTAVLEQLAQRMRRRVRVAHQEAPCGAQLRVDVGPRLDAVGDEARHQRINAVAALGVIGPFGLAGG